MKWARLPIVSAPVEIIDGDRGKEYPKQSDFHESGFCLFLNTGNVRPDGFDFSNCQFISDDKDRRLRKGRLTREDLVMTTRGTIGNVAYFNENVPYEQIRINSGMVIFRADRKRLLPSFLFHFLRSPDFAGQATSLRSGVAQPQLPIRDINQIELPLPDVSTQGRIASILSAYDDLMENNRRRMVLLEDTARQVYQEWFVRLRFPGHEHTRIMDGVPKGWERKTALDAIQVLSGGTPKTTNPDYWDGDIPFYTPKDAADGIWVTDCERSITDLGLNNCNSRLYPKETVFISARGTVGKLNMAQRPMAMSQSCYALVGKNHLTQIFVYSAMQVAVDALRQQAVGAVFDAIVVDTFKRIPLLVPETKIVRLFDETVRPMFDQVENLTIQNQKLRTARNLLLPKLMSGEISV